MPFDPFTDFFITDGLPPDVNSANNAGPTRVLALPADPNYYRCEDSDQTPLSITQIVDGRNKGPTAFWAYWCPYDLDRFGYTTLTNQADFMFTATMDGCSFGVGHAASDGSVIVGHVNSTGLQTPTGDTTAMEQDQHEKLNMILVSGKGGKKKPATFEPRDYRFNNNVREVNATTFGVREGGRWKFYAHRWIKTYNGPQVVYQYLDIKRIK